MKKMIFGFIAGVAVGVFGAYKYLDNQYKKRIEEEIESVKDIFSKRVEHEKEKNEQLEEELEEAVDLIKTSMCTNKTDYTHFSKKDDPILSKPDANPEPYEITEEEFGDHMYYTKSNLLYFTDGILAEEMNFDKIGSLQDPTWSSLLSMFESNEDADVMWVRDERLKVDYEICRDYRTYEEVLKMPPYHM